MNRLHLVLCGILLAGALQAQQLPLFTQYRENATILNPAAVPADYLAFEQNISFGASYRSQWTGLNGNPTTATLRGDYLYAENGVGFNIASGGYVMNDQTGPTGFTGIYGRVGGIVTSDPYYGGFSAGLSFGMVQYRVNASEIRLRDVQEQLTIENQSQWNPDVGVGLFAYKRIEGGFLDDDMVYGGISVPQVLGFNLEFKDEIGDFSIQRTQHYYANVGFYHFFREDGFIEPSAWVKYTPNTDVNVDINLRYQMQNNFWIGVGGSTAGAAHLEAGVLIGDNAGFDNNLKIGYGFDYNFSDFGPDAGTTHEINISYSFER